MGSDRKEPETIDLEKTEWESERKGEYPRKTWFGLTDYGPPPRTWDNILTYALSGGMVALGIGLAQLCGWY